MKERVISAVVMITLFVPILILGDIYYTIFGGILGIMALWEILNLKKEIPVIMKVISFFFCLLLIIYSVCHFTFLENKIILILTIMFLIYSVSIIIKGDLSKYNYKDAMWLFIMTLMTGFLFNRFVLIRTIGLNEVIYCFLISTMTDTFALFGGKLFGKNKLTTISPNKTIEGCISGSFFGTIIASVFYYLAIGNIDLLVLVMLTLLLTILGQIGDLFFSSIKRVHNIKDFSNLIPGHGGILDRLDSVLFVILGFLLYTIIV